MLQDRPIGPAQDGELQIVLATDGGYASRVEVAVYSLLENLSCPARIVLICTDDAKGQFPRLEKVMPQFPQARLEFVYPQFLRDLSVGHDHMLPPAALGRLLIPHLMEGRVFYIDGDVLVRKDMAFVRDFDLEGFPVAASQDMLFKRFVRRVDEAHLAKTDKEKRAATIAAKKLVPFQGWGLDFHRYYNSGVMIFDCDLIQSEPDVMDALLDPERARQYPTLDQDLINLIFAGRFKDLNQTWNAWRNISITNRAPFTAQEQADTALARKDPMIVHYYTKPKPWDPLSRTHFTRGFKWHCVYWTYERRFNRLAT